MELEPYWERYRTHTEIRQHGAAINLGDGIQITTQGIDTRLIAWPGNGFQTESVHVLTVKPGEQSTRYTYDMAEEAMICFKGKGEVFLRGQWLPIEPGDFAYLPAGVEHGVRNPASNRDDFVLVSQICPPQFDLYQPAGYYDVTNGVMNYDAIEHAKINAPRLDYSPFNEMAFRDTHPEVRAWNLSNDEIRRSGALFNVYYGAPFSGLVGGTGSADGPPTMLLILFAGYGTGATGFNYAYMDPGVSAVIHTHPVSDECVVYWSGGGESWVGDRWVTLHGYDCLLAPCGVRHGGFIPREADQPLLVGGFASPPQLDLLLKSGYYEDGKFRRPDFARLEVR